MGQAVCSACKDPDRTERGGGVRGNLPVAAGGGASAATKNATADKKGVGGCEDADMVEKLSPPDAAAVAAAAVASTGNSRGPSRQGGHSPQPPPPAQPSPAMQRRGSSILASKKLAAEEPPSPPMPAPAPFYDRVERGSAAFDMGGVGGGGKRGSLTRQQTSLTSDHGGGGGTARVCLMGGCESGKTTVFEQMRRLSRIPVPATELHLRRAFIYDLVVNSMLKILNYAVKIYGGNIDAVPFVEGASNREHATLLLNAGERVSGQPLTDQEYVALGDLWDDELVRELFATRRFEFGLSDSLGYFFDSLARISDPEFEPVHEDLVMAYIPTIGVQEFQFTFNKRDYHIFDVGGGKLDTRRWMSAYDNLSGIIFTIAISNFDSELGLLDSAFADPTRPLETDFSHSLHLLQQVVAEERFAHVPVFVFLNEVDVLKEKLRARPGSMHTHFADYGGGATDHKAAREYLLHVAEQAVERVLAVEGNPRRRRSGGANNPKANGIEFHFTCCIDTRPTQRLLMKILKKI